MVELEAPLWFLIKSGALDIWSHLLLGPVLLLRNQFWGFCRASLQYIGGWSSCTLKTSAMDVNHCNILDITWAHLNRCRPPRGKRWKRFVFLGQVFTLSPVSPPDLLRASWVLGEDTSFILHFQSPLCDIASYSRLVVHLSKQKSHPLNPVDPQTHSQAKIPCPLWKKMWRT